MQGGTKPLEVVTPFHIHQRPSATGPDHGCHPVWCAQAARPSHRPQITCEADTHVKMMQMNFSEESQPRDVFTMVSLCAV